MPIIPGSAATKKAQHYEISKIIRNAETKWEAVYRYKAKAGFKGNDYVEIKTRRGSDGANSPTEIKTNEISIVVQ